MSRSLLIATSLFLGVVGCDDLEAPDAEKPSSGQPDAQQPAPVGAVEGARTLQVDSSKQEVWTYLDLESAQTAVEPAQLPGWDIALQRMNIKLNGGVSGTAGVEASAVSGTTFAALTAAPTAGWGSDTADGADADGAPDYLLSAGDTGWYDYDSADHTLKPRPVVYALKSSEGKYYKLAVLTYYNDAGSSGYPKLQWEKVTAPAGPTSRRDAGTVDETTSASKPAAADAGTAGR